MIPTLGETLLALAGLWRFAREGAPALRFFDRSMAGFWRSFGVAAIVAPLEVALIATQVATPADAAGWLRLIVVETSAYVISWIALPVILYEIAARLHRLPHYVDFVVLYNWTNLPVLTISLALALLVRSGVVGEVGLQVLYLIFETGILAFEWFIARQTLRFNGLACAGLVALDFSIAVAVENAVAQLS